MQRSGIGRHGSGLSDLELGPELAGLVSPDLQARTRVADSRRVGVGNGLGPGSVMECFEIAFNDPLAFRKGSVTQ